MALWPDPPQRFPASPAVATEVEGEVHITLAEGGDRRALCGRFVPAGEGVTSTMNVSCPGCAQAVRSAIASASAGSL